MLWESLLLRLPLSPPRQLYVTSRMRVCARRHPDFGRAIPRKPGHSTCIFGHLRHTKPDAPVPHLQTLAGYQLPTTTHHPEKDFQIPTSPSLNNKEACPWNVSLIDVAPHHDFFQFHFVWNRHGTSPRTKAKFLGDLVAAVSCSRRSLAVFFGAKSRKHRSGRSTSRVRSDALS